MRAPIELTWIVNVVFSRGNFVCYFVRIFGNHFWFSLASSSSFSTFHFSLFCHAEPLFSSKYQLSAVMRVMRAAYYNFRYFSWQFNNNVSYLYFHLAFDVLTHIHFTARLRRLFRHSAIELNSFPFKFQRKRIQFAVGCESCDSSAFV